MAFVFVWFRAANSLSVQFESAMASDTSGRELTEVDTAEADETLGEITSDDAVQDLIESSKVPAPA
jgi:hypothetical protein